MSHRSYNRCRSCGAEIRFVRHERTGRHMPLEPAPEDATKGLFRVVKEGDDVFARPTTRQPLIPETLYLSHFATCPDAPAWRRPKGESEG